MTPLSTLALLNKIDNFPRSLRPATPEHPAQQADHLPRKMARSVPLRCRGQATPADPLTVQWRWHAAPAYLVQVLCLAEQVENQ